ncbi:MAG: hypothetical protein U0164_06635 [Gemmatimonadaceae bacterium]
MRVTLGVIALGSAAAGCTATLPVRTLPAHQTRWMTSVGGPVAPDHVMTKVIPYLTVGAMHGLSDRTTVSGSLHVLSAAFGIAGADVGVARRLASQSGVRPELTGQAQLYAFAASGGARLFPNVAGTLSWSAGPRTLVYTGSSLTAQFSGEHRVLVSPSLGIQRDVRRRLTLQLESRWLAANVNTERGLLEGESGIAGHGGFALLLGAQVRR